MNAKGVCPIGCEHAIRGAWYAFGLEEAQRRQAETAAMCAPEATQGNKGDHSPIRIARRRWVTKLKVVTPCRGRHWPSTPEEAGQLQLHLHWRAVDMWSAVDYAETRTKSARRPSNREGEQRDSPAPESNARRQEANKPTPLPAQHQAADPPAAYARDSRSDSEPILSIRLPFICLRPPHQGTKWVLLHSERARRFAVKRSLVLFKEFQATIWEEVQRNANAYLTKPPTEKGAVESQRETEEFHRQLAKSLYKEFAADMKRKLADIQNGVPDDDDLVDNLDAEDNGGVDESDYILMTPRSGENSVPEIQQSTTHQTEGRPGQQSANPHTMPPAEPTRSRDTSHDVAEQYPPRSSDVHRGELRGHRPILQRTAESDDRNSRAPSPGQAATQHQQEHVVDPPVGPIQYQRGAHHHRSYSDNAFVVRPPPAQFLDPTNPPTRDPRQSRLRSASVSSDARPQWVPEAEATGIRYQCPSAPPPGRAASRFNSARLPPPKARPDSAPINRHVPPHNNNTSPYYGAKFHYPTPPQYMPATLEESVPSELPDEAETADQGAVNLQWLDEYCSDQYIAGQYMDVANAFKDTEMADRELSDLEEGRLSTPVIAGDPAPTPMLRSGVTPRSSRVSNMAVPPLIASEESNTDSDSDATVSDFAFQSESDSDETPTQSTFSSPSVSVHIPKILRSFVGQKLPTSTSQIMHIQRMAGRQAETKYVRSERREVHFAEEPAVRYFKG